LKNALECVKYASGITLCSVTILARNNPIQQQ
jgi:hypothetical protein